MAGAATVVAARPPAPALLMNFRLDSFVIPVLLGGGPTAGRRRFAIFALASPCCRRRVTLVPALPAGRGTIGGSRLLRNCHLRRDVDQFGVALGDGFLEQGTVAGKSVIPGVDFAQL